jgi:hypothetical protein
VASPLLKGFKQRNSICRIFKEAQNSDEKSDSTQFVKLCFRPGGIGESEIVYQDLYTNPWVLVNQIDDFGRW